MIVKPKPGKPTLHIDTVLFIEKEERRKALGQIFDVFGPVSEPNYCIRFNDSEHIRKSNITVGMLVYYCSDTEFGYTSLIFQQQLKMLVVRLLWWHVVFRIMTYIFKWTIFPAGWKVMTRWATMSNRRYFRMTRKSELTTNRWSKRITRTVSKAQHVNGNVHRVSIS